MESKQVILNKLRKTRLASKKSAENCSRPSYTPEGVFADIPLANSSALLEQFSKKLTALRGEVYSVPSLAEAAQQIALIAKECRLEQCGRQQDPLLDVLFNSYSELRSLEARMTRVAYGETLPHSAIEKMECSFTVADALIARTGSVVLRSTTAGGRRLSVLPPMHCVVALRSQLVPSLSSWLSEVYRDRTWSYGTIITGPSRTADIERILVLGAHGPKRLVVIVVDEAREHSGLQG